VVLPQSDWFIAVNGTTVDGLDVNGYPAVNV